jgi:8-oxo-dGTP diphosphatase
VPVREPCADAVVLSEDGRLLLVQRAHDPSAGLWSVPGGRCLPDEPAALACVREAAEETGLQVRLLHYLGSVEVTGPDGRIYDIDSFACAVVGGELRAGDDAADARWVSADELAGLDLVPGLLDCLVEWDALPR